MLVIKNLTKRFNGQPIVEGFDLTVPTNGFTVLIGPSGCGKTTTLKMINRLIEPTEGIIEIGGTNVKDHDPISLRRQIGYIFQGIGLFPHMTIEQNVGLVPRLLGWPTPKRMTRVQGLLETVGLPVETFADRFPDELSGGQQQRVGVARALAADPEYLLMDEPFGALDTNTRFKMQLMLKGLWDSLQCTVIFVTHDIQEAVFLGDDVYIMSTSPAQITRLPR